MTKNLEIMNDLVQTANHPFRQRDDRPDRAQQHRYERRRIRQYVRRGGWRRDEGPFPAGGLPAEA